MNRRLTVALIYPPLADPSCGYISLPYLASFLRSRTGHDVRVIDANIESILYCARAGNIARLIDKARCMRQSLGSSKLLTTPEGRSRLEDILAVESLTDAASVHDAMNVMRDPRRFWNYAEYYPAALRLMQFLRLLAIDGFPGQFSNFTLAESPLYNLCNLQELSSDAVLERMAAPFQSYVADELAPALGNSNADVAGISVIYHEQLPFAMAMAKEIKKQLPAVKIVFGGTDISQGWKYSKSTRSFDRLFSFADACVVGEGETAFAELLDAYAAERAPDGVGGVVTRNSYSTRQDTGARYECVDDLPCPSYDDLPWSSYLSPTRFVYYAPTRGCYWDKCTFCDYGLADGRPTSPWRQRSLRKVVEDLRAIQKISEYVYLSVDVIAPSFLVKLAQCLIDEGIKIKWGAELRLESYFSTEHCDLLARSGCTGISVGFESGNQRILNLIDKGTKAGKVKDVIKAFHGAGIAVQIMGFTGFPTETYAEAMESVRLLEELKEFWVFGGLGDFKLTAGAIVAKDPARFGLRSVSPRSGDDVHAYLDYREATASKSAAETAGVAECVSRLRHQYELPRPFMGGTDTAHSYMYFDRYGTDTKAQCDLAAGQPDAASRLKLRGAVNRLPDENGSVGEFFLTLEDGRTIGCTRFTYGLQKLLDGSRTYDQILDRLREEHRDMSLLYESELQALSTNGYLRVS